MRYINTLLLFGIFILLGILILCCGFQGANGSSGGYEKQIRLAIKIPDNQIISTATENILSSQKCFTNFDVNNYININTVYFKAWMATDQIGGTCIVDLYNLTDGMAIAGSEIQTTDTTEDWVEISVPLNAFPNYEIDLGIRVRHSGVGYSFCNVAYLYLYRN